MSRSGPGPQNSLWFVATNHPEFRGPRALARVAALTGADALVVDPWNCFGAAQVFAYAAEVAALQPAS